MHEGGKAAEKINAQRFGGAIKCMSQRRQICCICAGGDVCNRRDRDALVGNGDSVFALKVAGNFHQMFRLPHNTLVNLLAHAVQIIVRARIERYSHGNCAEVKILLADHCERFGNFLRRNVHADPLRVGFMVAKNLSHYIVAVSRSALVPRKA